MTAPATDLLAEPTVTVIEAARVLGLTKDAYYRGIRSGELPGIFVGDRVLILRRWLELVVSGDWQLRRRAADPEAVAEAVAAKVVARIAEEEAKRDASPTFLHRRAAS